MKIRPVGAEFLHEDRQMDGRTDMTKLIFAFRNFANMLEKEMMLSATQKRTLRLLGQTIFSYRNW